jgi:hypothetical protein
MNRLDGGGDMDDGSKIEQHEVFNILADLENKGKISQAQSE